MSIADNPRRFHIGYWADTWAEAKRLEAIIDTRLPNIDDQRSGIIGGRMVNGKFVETFEYDLSTVPVEPSDEQEQ